MDNLEDRLNYGKKEFALQWHITDKCDMRCKHCYIPHQMKQKNMRKEFPDEKAKELIDEFSILTERWGIKGRINFSGGNPILHENFFEIIEYAEKKDLHIGILGNPTSVLKEDILEKLKERKIFRYQISIDGLKENHEEIRGKGLFEVALKGLDVLISANIPAVVLSTVTTKNMKDIPKLAELVFDKGVKVFDFARLVPTGEGENLSHLMPTPEQYHAFLLNMYDTYLKINKADHKFKLPVKDPLWMLLHRELGLLNPKFINSNKIYGGCSIGITSFCVDVNGDAYSCRRLEIPIGNVFEKSLRDIFINSEEMSKHRDYPSIEECGGCDILSVCRGCRAIAYAVNGKYTSKDPQCWRVNNE